MKTALISDVKHFAVHDGPGIRTTLFFKGCPLKCVWCHNPEGLSFAPQLAHHASKCLSCGECVLACPQNAHEMKEGKHLFLRERCVGCGECVSVCPGEALHRYGTGVTVEEILPQLLQDRAFYENGQGGITLSGGECLSQAEFCAELLARLKEEGIHTAVDTCGFVSREMLNLVIPYTDLFLYDLKAIDPEVHRHCTGQDNALILENLKYLDSLGKKIEIRIPFVPHWNDGEIKAIRDFLRPLKNITKVKVLPYHRYAGSKYDALEIPNTLPERTPTPEELSAAEALFR